MHFYYCHFGATMSSVKWNACWANAGNFLNKYIYIDKFKNKKTEKHIKYLIKLINEITPCKIVKVKKRSKKYIKFKMLDNYDKSLILLSFIRNLWYEPTNNYTEKFFNNLIKSEEIDPLAKLTYANKMASIGVNYRVGHSNAAPKLKIKTSKQLFKCSKLNNVMDFLT